MQWKWCFILSPWSVYSIPEHCDHHEMTIPNIKLYLCYLTLPPIPFLQQQPWPIYPYKCIPFKSITLNSRCPVFDQSSQYNLFWHWKMYPSPIAKEGRKEKKKKKKINTIQLMKSLHHGQSARYMPYFLTFLSKSTTLMSPRFIAF